MTLALSTQGEPRVHRWTRDEYYAMAEAGLFNGRRVELIGGTIVEMSPQNERHYQAIHRVHEALRSVLGQEHWIRIQAPLRVSGVSDPEPDIAVVQGRPEDYDDHPTTAVLIVEVSDTTLEYDRTTKASLYASAGVGDYWVLNLPDRRLQVHRDPIADQTEPFGHRYGELRTIAEDGAATPLTAPDARLPVADLLPPQRVDKS